MSYRSTPSFEQQPRLFEYQRAIFKLHMLAKFDKERIISFSHLIEAREKEVAQQRAKLARYALNVGSSLQVIAQELNIKDATSENVTEKIIAAIQRARTFAAMQQQRVLAYADLAEARELEIADMQSDAREQGEHD